MKRALPFLLMVLAAPAAADSELTVTWDMAWIGRAVTTTLFLGAGSEAHVFINRQRVGKIQADVPATFTVSEGHLEFGIMPEDLFSIPNEYRGMPPARFVVRDGHSYTILCQYSWDHRGYPCRLTLESSN